MDQAKETASLPIVNISNKEDVEIESEITQLSTLVSTTKELMYTTEFLKGGKQVRCIWCSCVNLIGFNFKVFGIQLRLVQESLLVSSYCTL